MEHLNFTNNKQIRVSNISFKKKLLIMDRRFNSYSK